MNWNGFLSIGVLLALVVVAAFLIIYRPIRPDSPRPSPKDRAELTSVLARPCMMGLPLEA
jgi:amino acid transporter